MEKNNSDVALPRVGDPCMSSGLNELRDIFDGFDAEIVPGISSIQLGSGYLKAGVGKLLKNREAEKPAIH
jgi:precorrin-6B methylase 1